MLYRLGLIGEAVSKSLSPILHQTALNMSGLTGVYTPYEASKFSLSSLLGALRRGELHGLNVTIPFKQKAFSLCDTADPVATACGAVNTLLRLPDGRIQGHNTDVSGLVEAIKMAFPTQNWSRASCCVQGAGGAARAAVLAAHTLGVSRIVVVNRTLARAEALASALNPHLSITIVPTADPLAGFEGADLVLQASSMGMDVNLSDPRYNTLRDLVCARLSQTKSTAKVMDLVYRPEQTVWLAASKELNRDAVGGIPMLIHQALLAFELWTGTRPPFDAFMQALS
jgi:shikimate dehydrogenase